MLCTFFVLLRSHGTDGNVRLWTYSALSLCNATKNNTSMYRITYGREFVISPLFAAFHNDPLDTPTVKGTPSHTRMVSVPIPNPATRMKVLRAIVTSWDSMLGYGYVRIEPSPPTTGSAAGAAPALPHTLSTLWVAAGQHHFGAPPTPTQWLISRKMFQLQKTIRAAEVDLSVGDVCEVTFVCNEQDGGGYSARKIDLQHVNAPNRILNHSQRGFIHSKSFRVRPSHHVKN
jgi:hypothetical protein